MIERLLYVMTFLAIGWVLFSPSGPDEPADPACANSGVAWAMTKAMVREQLGRPLAVSFPDPSALDGVEDIKLAYLGGCRHRIAAFVDTYYRPDDRTRRAFVVELSYHGQLGWRLDRLEIDDPRRS